MITLKRLNVVREVATAEQAEKLKRVGFEEIGGEAEAGNTLVSEARLAQVTGALLKRINKSMRATVSKASVQPDSNEEGASDGAGSVQPDSSDGTK